MSSFDLIIFDCDGVLVDSELSTNGVLCDMLNENGANLSLEESMNIFMGRAVEESYDTIAAVIGKPTPKNFYEEFIVRRNAGLENVQAIPYIAEVLPKLPLPFAVASGAETAKMNLTLGKTNLKKYFEGRMFGKDMVARSKPAPDVYLLAAKTLGVNPARCIVIEDSTTGTTAGVAAGMTVLGYCAHTKAEKLLAAGAVATFHDMRNLPLLVRA